MKLDGIHPYSYNQSFRAGKVKVFSDFDRTFLPAGHKEFLSIVKKRDGKELKAIFKSFSDFLKMTKESLSFIITTGRTFGEYAEMAELSREGNLGMPLPDALITKNGGDVHLKTGTDEAFYNGGEFPFKYDITDKLKENYIKTRYNWDGDGIKNTFKEEYKANGLRIVEADSEHSPNDHGERSLFSAGKLSDKVYQDEWSVGFRNDGKLKFFVLGPNDNSGQKSDIIKQMDKHIKSELEKKGIKFLLADYDVNVRGRHGVDLGPDLDGEHLTKAYDTKLAVRKAWEENDLVIAAGDSSNDTEMINPITYLLDEGCFAKSLTPENKTYLKKHINEPAKIIEYLDANSKVAEDFLSLPYCGIILKNEDSDLFAKFKPFAEGKYQKLVVAKQGELEKGIKDAIALYSKQTPKYKEVLDSELKKQIADNEPPHKPDDEGGNNFWKYILGGGCVIGLIAAVHKMVKNKKAPVIAGE